MSQDSCTVPHELDVAEMTKEKNVEKDKSDEACSPNLRKSKFISMAMVEEFCVFCYGTNVSNDEQDVEELLRCSECFKYAHPSCLEMPDIAVEKAKTYDWECNDCKGCFQCKKKNKEKSIILCDFCDRGFHTFCLEKKASRSAKVSWKCPVCTCSELVTLAKDHKPPKNVKKSKQLASQMGKGEILDAVEETNESQLESETLQKHIENISVWEEGNGASPLDEKLNVATSSESVSTFSVQKTPDNNKGSEPSNADAVLKVLGEVNDPIEASNDQDKDISDSEDSSHGKSLRNSFAKEGKETNEKSTADETEHKMQTPERNQTGIMAPMKVSQPDYVSKNELKQKSVKAPRRISKRLSGIPAAALDESIAVKIEEVLRDDHAIVEESLEENNEKESLMDNAAREGQYTAKHSAKDLSDECEHSKEIEARSLERSEGSSDKKKDEPNEIKENQKEEDQQLEDRPQAVVVKRKRGRPRKNRHDGKQSDNNKLVKSPESKNIRSPIRSKEDLHLRSCSRSSSDVLISSSREPPITPTTCRSISNAQTVRKAYPIRDRETPTESKPGNTKMTKPCKLSPMSGRMTKTPTKESQNSHNRCAQKSKLTPQKRKLIFEEDPGFGKKRKYNSQSKEGGSDTKITANAADSKNKTRMRKEARGKTTGADSSGLGRETSPGSGVIDNLVTMADVLLFEQAQSEIKKESAANENNALDQGIKTVDFGDYVIDTWYSSPYPSEFRMIGKVFVCEFCLKYMKSATILRRHMAKCLWRHPPGEEIYRKDHISFFEVDGEKSPSYCQNLCLLAKLFLDHKTLYYEVEPFLFYVMTIADSSGCHIIGYFSKEKVSFLNYNVSCILVLPQYMRKGYGKILIDFSYLLSRAEGKIGSPERPLSDLGLISYRSYWKDVLLGYLSSFKEENISIKEMSQKTAILSNDLISTMQALGILKYWKGQHVILMQQEMLDAYIKRSKSRSKLKLDVDESCLSWTPKNYGQSRGRVKIL